MAGVADDVADELFGSVRKLVMTRRERADTTRTDTVERQGAR